MGYAQETQHSQLTQWIQVFIYSLKFEDEVLLESCGHNIFIFFSRGHKKRPVNHKSCLVLSSYWCEANKDLTGLARFVVWFGLLGAVTVLRHLDAASCIFALPDRGLYLHFTLWRRQLGKSSSPALSSGSGSGSALRVSTLKDIPVSGRDSSRQRWKSYTNEEEK